MARVLLWIALCVAASAAQASYFEEAQKAIFDESGNQIKPEFRKCKADADCIAVVSFCRWRPARKDFSQSIAEISNKARLECKWPGVPAEAPLVKCIEQLCQIPPDGKYN